MFDMLENQTGRVYVRKLKNGSLELQGESRDTTIRVPHSPCVTNYPMELIRLIFEAYGAIYTCDEIERDIDETDAALDVRYSVLAHFGDELLSRPLRILDYGCGAGSSSLVLSRLFPFAHITGMDFVNQFLEIARLRAGHYGLQNVQFQQVPMSGDFGRPRAGFDMVFLNAVYEHLLPPERPTVLANVWAALNPRGTLILNQTPHRWFPVETHTSGLALINYLPDSLALWAVHKFSKRAIRHSSWDQLLRAGVRGASVSEIMRHLSRIDPNAVRLQPIRLAASWAGIWYAAKRARLRQVQSRLLRAAIVATERFVRLTRLPISPYVNIAISKGSESSAAVRGRPLR
jgi:2-polyprenyl-3-methyl-5-hydroxy-6-metoxy-1,4-benzoquinol methylase